MLTVTVLWRLSYTPKCIMNSKMWTLFLLLVINFSSCISFGPEKPVAKSKTMRYTSPAQPWRTTDSGQADVAFQHPSGDATISLNSVCHQYQDYSLEELTKQLLLGISDPVRLRQNPITINKNTGLMTVIEGKMDTLVFHMSVVVVRSHECIYDFSLIGRPESFEKHEAVFLQFLQSFSD